jgi:polyhydroxyalkanoate synthesis regulator phasin/predicted transcriptional regulator
MPVSGKLVADFTSFYTAVQKADVSLDGLERSSENVEKSLNRLAESYSGGRVIQQATLAAEAVQRLGGVTTLTAAQQDRLNATVEKGIAAYTALGKVAPDSLLSTQAALKAVQTETSGVAGYFGEIGSGIAEMAASFVSAQAVVELFAKSFAFAKEAIADAAALEDLSRATGISTDGLQRLAYVGQEFGVGTDQMARGVETLSQKLASGDKSAVAAVQALGLNVNKLIEAGPQEAFLEVADAAGKVSDPMLKGANAADLFGARLAKQLIPLLGDLRTKMGQVPQDAIISKETIESAHEFEVGLDHLITRMKAFTAETVVSIGKSLEWKNKWSTAITGLEVALHTGTTFGLALQTVNEAVDANTHALDSNLPAEKGATDRAVELANTLKALRAEALTPLTAEQRSAAVELDKYGKSAKEISVLLGGVGESAVKNYLEAHKAAAAAVDKHREAIAKLQDQLSGADLSEKVVNLVDAWTEVAAAGQATGEAFHNLGAEAVKLEKDGAVLSGILKQAADSFQAEEFRDAIAKLEPKWLEDTRKLTAKMTKEFQTSQLAIAEGYAKMLVTAIEVGNEFEEKNAELAKSSTQIALDGIEKQRQARINALGPEVVQDAAAYARATAEINKFYNHQRDVANETADTIQERMRALGVFTVDDLQYQADEAKKQYDQMRESGDFTARELQASWDRMINAELAETSQLVIDVTQGFADIGSAALNAFATGGSIGKALEGGVTSLGKNLGTDLLKGPLESLGQKVGGGALAKALGSMAGPLGEAAASLGLAVGKKLWDKFFGSAGRDAVTSFAATMGGFDALQKQLDKLGPAGQQLWIGLTQGVGKNDAAGAAAAIKKVQDALAALSADETKYNLADPLQKSNDAATALYNSFGDLVSAGHATSDVVTAMSGDVNDWLSAALDAGVRIPPGMQPVLDQLIQMGKLTDDNARKLLGLDTKLDGGTFDDITAAAGRYGLQLDALGPKVNQLNIEKQATQLSSDWKLLTSDGEDVNAVMTAMSGKVQDVVTAAYKFGDTIPKSMQPMIDQMIGAGKLTDDLGNKLTDDSGINWEEPLGDQVQDLVSAINDLVGALTGSGSNSLSSSLETIGNKVVSPKVKPVYDGSGLPADYGGSGGPSLSPGQSSSVLTAPPGGNVTVNVNASLTADGRELAKVVVPNIPAVVTSKGLNRG